MDASNNTNKVTVSLVISILSFIISLSTFIYTIVKDNEESFSVWCLEYDCMYYNDDRYELSGTYIITNTSHNTSSIVDAYVTYDGTRISSSLDEIDIFPLTLNAGESYEISIDPQYVTKNLQAQLFELKIISSSQKAYSAKSKYF